MVKVATMEVMRTEESRRAIWLATMPAPAGGCGALAGVDCMCVGDFAHHYKIVKLSFTK